MDGSERIEYAEPNHQEEVVVEAPATVAAAEEEEEEEITYTISQPQVIVERVVPEDLILEEAEEEEAEEGEEEEADQQNGTDNPPPATLDDIIADAVAPDNNNGDPSTTEDAKAATTTTADDSAAAKNEDEADASPPPPPRKKQEPSLELNQCRCCTSRDDLLDIFQPLENATAEGGDAAATATLVPASALITKLCSSSVTITKRDHLPNLICRSCAGRLQQAWEFRELCEKTDQQLRESLPRAKKVVRKRTDYQLIDYESSSGEDAGANDDEEEFKLSEELSEDASEASDSDVDYEDVPKKRGRPPGKKRGRPPSAAAATASATPPVRHVTGTAVTPRGRGRPRKSEVRATPTSVTAKTKAPRAAIVYVEAKEESDEEEEDDDEEEEEKPLAKQAKRQCAKCKVILLGKTPHVCKAASFACSFCAEKFATHPLYMNHQQLHTNFQNANTCVRCHKQFAAKAELRKHQSGVRCHKATKNNCTKCGRVLANASQLAIHLRTKCQPVAGGVVKREGGGGVTTVKKENMTPKKEKNLFKFVAPTTSTYWSDSCSD